MSAEDILVTGDALLTYCDDIKKMMFLVYSINFPFLKNIDEYVDETFQRLASYIKDESAILLGIVSKNKLQGFLWAYKRVNMGACRIHVRDIVVNPDFQRTGIGKRLLTEVELMAKCKDVNAVELFVTNDNVKALRFYEKNGYRSERMLLCKNV